MLKAIVLCAGVGKRLLPYTKNYPKPMLLIHGKPILEYILNGLIDTGFKEIILVVGYRKEQIIDYFKDGKNWNASLEYVEQKNLNGTGGALLLCEKLIDKRDHFFLTWGDILVPYSVYKDVITTFKEERDDFILVTNYSTDPHKGGAVYCRDKYCFDIVEKPPKGKSISTLNNCGIFIFPVEIFEILNDIKPSKRGEIELTEALKIGIIEKNWKIRVLKMKKHQFRGDFGDKTVFEGLRIDTNWIKELR